MGGNSSKNNSALKKATLPRDLSPFIPIENKTQYKMWRTIHDFDFGFDLTFDERLARENCNDRGEILNNTFANMVKYEMVYYFFLCYQELEATGKLKPSVDREDERLKELFDKG